MYQNSARPCQISSPEYAVRQTAIKSIRTHDLSESR